MIQTSLRGTRLRLPAMALVLAIAPVALAIDSDLDGVDNRSDNCQLVANTEQRDTDGDGFGNPCDADLNNDGVVNAVDLGAMRSVFYSSRPHAEPAGEHADMDGDGVVNVADLGLLRSGFGLPPGPAATASISADDAARFLSQATFGPRDDQIDTLIASGDYDAWIDAQLSAPYSWHEPLTRVFATRMCFDMPVDDAWYFDARLAAWWENALFGQDQLRQRVAFALSQILVVSASSEKLVNSQFAMADYYDMLVENALGNYRTLLEDMTKHAVMGIFLGHVRNQRARPDLNIRPDENFAREIMQLFTIGVQMLNIDGTPLLDGDGNSIPTYTQADIGEFARVYTGWNYNGIPWLDWWGNADRGEPMQPVEQYHDDEPKTLLGVDIPGGQSAQQDLDVALDVLFNHPNAGPFLASRLIQRLATSNPTPEYIARVAQAFNDNGDGVRGDLSAVVRAILLDPEARSGHVYIPDRFGKLREPLLRLTHVRRSFNMIVPQLTGFIYDQAEQCGQPAWSNYRSLFGSFASEFGQEPLGSPSVFNFYLPDYAPPGDIRDAGYVAPEFQIFNANSMQTSSQAISWEIWNEGQWGPGWPEIDVSTEAALADNPTALLDRLDLLMMAGQMSIDLRSRIVAHLNRAPFPPGAEGRNVKARDAIMLIANSPEYLIQK